MFYSLSSSSFSYQAEATGTDGGKIQPQSRIGSAYVRHFRFAAPPQGWGSGCAQCVPPATFDLQHLCKGRHPTVRNVPSAKNSASMLETQDCSMHGSATSLHRQVAKSAPNRAAGRRGAGASQRFHGRRPADFILCNQPARGIQSRRKSTGILPRFPPSEQSCAKSAIRYLQEGPVKRAPRRKMGTGGSQGIKRKNGAGKAGFFGPSE